MNKFIPVALVTAFNPSLDYHMNDLRMKELARHLRNNDLYPNAISRVVDEDRTVPYYIVEVPNGSEEVYNKIWHYAQAFDMPSILGIDANQKAFRIDINNEIKELQRVKASSSIKTGSFMHISNPKVYYIVE